jgi:hypothetical protein
VTHEFTWKDVDDSETAYVTGSGRVLMSVVADVIDETSAPTGTYSIFECVLDKGPIFRFATKDQAVAFVEGMFK